MLDVKIVINKADVFEAKKVITLNIINEINYKASSQMKGYINTVSRRSIIGIIIANLDDVELKENLTKVGVSIVVNEGFEENNDDYIQIPFVEFGDIESTKFMTIVVNALIINEIPFRITPI